MTDRTPVMTLPVCCSRTVTSGPCRFSLRVVTQEGRCAAQVRAPGSLPRAWGHSCVLLWVRALLSCTLQSCAFYCATTPLRGQEEREETVWEVTFLTLAAIFWERNRMCAITKLHRGPWYSVCTTFLGRGPRSSADCHSVCWLLDGRHSCPWLYAQCLAWYITHISTE